jgi:acyl-CoA synthetase (AMP-forming)/AMP-acid ligase II
LALPKFPHDKSNIFTGLPKVVIFTHAMYNSFDGLNILRKEILPEKLTLEDVMGTRFYCPLPIFHLLGGFCSLAAPLFFKSTVVLGPAAGAATATDANSVHAYGKPQCGIYPPFVLEELARDPTKLKNLGSLRSLLYGGAPIAEQAAKLISKVAGLYPVIGNTENGAWPTLQTMDPSCYQFTPQIGLYFEAVGVGHMREAVMLRKPEIALHQPLFQAFPEMQTFRTKDLWQKHPTITDGWKYIGRTDDMILLTGEVKMYVATIEAALLQHPLIQTVIVGGAGRHLPFALIELSDRMPLSEVQQDQVLTQIWPAMERANELCPEFVAITRKHTILVDPAKPLLKLGKGTLDRTGSLELYRVAIDKVYL